MAKTVFVLGTMDTKGPEFAYLVEQLESLGLETLVADCGILEEPLEIEPDVDHAELARYGDTTIEALQNAGSRGKAVSGMQKAIRNFTVEKYEEGAFDAVVSMGGAEGAVMGATAMMPLPYGVPKVLISPIASGKHFFEPMVGTKDVMVVHSVVDILGLNPIATTIFDNVAAATKGLVEEGHPLPDPDPDEKYVAVTMLGNTTKAVMALKERLAEDGYEAVVFHSNGAGGPAMEELAEAGQFDGVIDFTTNEVYDPMTGGIHDGGPDRLKVVPRLGIPQVVVPGCIDFSVFHTGTVPDELEDRPVYDHNPEYTLVGASREEKLKLADLFADRINPSTGPVRLAVPTEGLSIPNHPDGPFWDPEGDAAFRERLVEKMRSDIPIEMFEHHVNDPEFGVEVAERFLDLIEG